ncbi:CapA family protein [Candidatus Uhrbacteria bacterium]|nr:MAG: CapA family protein [Candidatus Uhrbacteria bacterium]
MAPIRAWRISGSICLGIALGIGAWILLPWPPPVSFRALADRLPRPGFAMSGGAIRGGGVETPEQRPVRILFVGDVMLDREVANRMRRANDPAYPFRALPEGWIASFDYAVGNLEGPVTDRRRPPEKSIDFLFDPSVIPTLQEQGFDAFSQANNHTLDQGAIGYEDSVRRLRKAGFLVFGHQVDDGLVALATTTIHGTRLAFLGFNMTDNSLNRMQATQAIATAKEQADVVIAFMHWGTEYRSRPDASSMQTARWLVETGVDVIIGGHPHWAQGFSTYDGKPIAWSLGNFIFDQDWSAQTRAGLAVALTISKPLASNFSYLTLEPIPIRIDQSRPRILEGEARAERLEEIARLSDEGLRDQIRAGKMEF